MPKTINITPEEFADKLARRLKAAIPDIQAGIQKVTENPMQKAASKKAKMLQNVTEAVQSGKWEAGLRRVSLDEWKQKFTEKGVNRIAQGIDSSKDKVVAFATQLLEYEKTLKGQIDQMPDLTLEDSLNRMTTWMRGMSKFRRK